MTRLRAHLTFSNIVAALALFIALGGVSYAAVKLPANSVGTTQLKNGSVTVKKLSPNAQASIRRGRGPHGGGHRGGRPGPTGATGPVATNSAVEAFFDSDTITIVGSTGDSKLSTTQLPKGTYLITSAMHVTSGYYSPLRCTLKDPSGAALDYSAIEMTPGFMGGGNDLTLTGTATLTDAGQLSIFCTFPDPNDVGHVVDFTIDTSALKVSAVHQAE